MSAVATGRARCHFVFGLLLLLALWPPIHRGLVARYAIDPWKLGGFAMYATYATTLTALFEPVPGGLALLTEERLPDEARRALLDFRARRSALGEWASPDELAAAVFAARPDLRGFVVVVQRLWLDPETARIASRKWTLPMERGEP